MNENLFILLLIIFNSLLLPVKSPQSRFRFMDIPILQKFLNIFLQKRKVSRAFNNNAKTKHFRRHRKETVFHKCAKNRF